MGTVVGIPKRPTASPQWQRGEVTAYTVFAGGAVARQTIVDGYLVDATTVADEIAEVPVPVNDNRPGLRSVPL